LGHPGAKFNQGQGEIKPKALSACEIGFLDIEPDVAFFNTWLFPYNTKKSLIYAR